MIDVGRIIIVIFFLKLCGLKICDFFEGREVYVIFLIFWFSLLWGVILERILFFFLNFLYFFLLNMYFWDFLFFFFGFMLVIDLCLVVLLFVGLFFFNLDYFEFINLFMNLFLGLFEMFFCFFIVDFILVLVCVGIFWVFINDDFDLDIECWVFVGDLVEFEKNWGILGYFLWINCFFLFFLVDLVLLVLL